MLTHLYLAWSRDDSEKFYVQDRMLQVGRELWAWIAEGAHVYVCGDAQRMAKDVERALIDIVAAHGARTDQRGGRLRRRIEEEPAAIRRTCIDTMTVIDSHADVREAKPPRMEPLARLPVFLALEGRRAVVAGGTAAAAWKAELLSAAGAEVEVYAPEPCEELLALAARAAARHDRHPSPRAGGRRHPWRGHRRRRLRNRRRSGALSPPPPGPRAFRST